MHHKLPSLLAVALLMSVATPASAQDSNDTVKVEAVSVSEALDSKNQENGPLENKSGKQDDVDERMKTTTGRSDAYDVRVEVGSDQKILGIRVDSTSWSHRSQAESKIKHERENLGKCADKALAKRNKSGRIALELEADAAGDVKDIRVRTTNLGDALTGCLEKTFSKIKFPKYNGKDKTQTVLVTVHWRPNYGDVKEKAKKAGGMGMRGNATKSDGFGRIGGLGRVDTGKTRSGSGTEKKTSIKPVLQISNISIVGGLSEKEASRVIEAKSNANKYCYEKQLQTHPTLAGYVDMKLTLSKDGRVAKAEAIQSTLGNKSVEGCLERTHQRMRFAKPGGDVEVEYRLDFSSKLP